MASVPPWLSGFYIIRFQAFRRNEAGLFASPLKRLKGIVVVVMYEEPVAKTLAFI
jgi:hypothetical protein